MTQPLGNPQGPLFFSPPSAPEAVAGGADVAGLSASGFFSVEVNGFEVFAVLLVVF
jgi:hypothetical protein